MPHVSKKKVNPKALERILDFLLISLADIKDHKEMASFANSFFTRTEKLMLAKRLGVAYLLSEKVPEDRIVEILCIGKPTIEKMRFLLQTEGQGYEIAIRILKRSENFAEFREIFSQILKKMAHPYKGILSQPNVR